MSLLPTPQAEPTSAARHLPGWTRGAAGATANETTARRPAAVTEIRLVRDGEIWRNLGPAPPLHGTPSDMLARLTGRPGGDGVSLVPVGQSFTPGPGGTGLPEPPPWPTMPAPLICPRRPQRTIHDLHR
ncbi:hypothetical protein GCM10022419_107550 [Nonomuraea rosea]|uniref:Uncharacterized protein n=1 Tax=Nonomuraea rosea TaxID=638574 RepID=A0ABP6ZDH2_9ACTN